MISLTVDSAVDYKVGLHRFSANGLQRLVSWISIALLSSFFLVFLIQRLAANVMDYLTQPAPMLDVASRI